ncbi:MAG: NADH-quinone oxidoreductase subunit C [Sulfuricurvum sp.]|uniref:NADH-quinone oxidoreductase subunit C n=1 Tax=Sulfuricurvum sp. TaxID=2025608 RepID=UPI0026268A3F|nr:NADH-quinone oxidoreductase subunit C [Sulfuricurvum sp.]MDD2369971.1 NADH-quinone oxidoreductase subunit C [Sulfuricurvum sp.]MDD2951464.1 NADH-quinone oxidoreductase subunit C [Sulfuricurvum sp.]MDD5117016.1 NADH-quinone oxidoreductase subunit C [Sulfuricurvum sp.]
MTKLETTLATLLADIGTFYEPKKWHFLTVNGIDLGEGKIELQWIFSKYGVKDEIVIYYALSDYETPVPSLVSLIPSAFMGEREIVDMFGLKVDGAERGLYLDEDSLQHPLRSES